MVRVCCIIPAMPSWDLIINSLYAFIISRTWCTRVADHFFNDLIILPQLGGIFCITYSVCQATVQDIPKALAEMDNDNNTSKLIMHIFSGKNLENKTNMFASGGGRKKKEVTLKQMTLPYSRHYCFSVYHN
jgi:hypothetical protein